MSELIVNTTLITEVCCACGMLFAMPRSFNSNKREDHKLFYCPAGHAQHYSEESPAEQAKREKEYAERRLRYEREDHEHTKNSLRSTKAAHTRTKNRVKNGVCPHCNRYFADLHKHMQVKHTDAQEGV